MLLPIALSFVEGCAQSPRSNVLVKYASSLACAERKPKDRFFTRLASQIFLSSGSAKRSAFFKAFEAMRARYVVVLPEAPAKDAAKGDAPAARKTR